MISIKKDYFITLKGLKIRNKKYLDTGKKISNI